MLRYTIKKFYPFFFAVKVEPREWVGTKIQCAVNGVTFHRIFRLVDPFVKVHILIIKLDRFSLAPFSLPVLTSVVVSPPHVLVEVWQYFCCAAVRRKKKILFYFSPSVLQLQCIRARRVNFSLNPRLDAETSIFKNARRECKNCQPHIEISSNWSLWINGDWTQLYQLFV